MNTSAKKAMTRRIVGAACVATIGIGAAACSSDDPVDDPDVETPVDDGGGDVEEVPEEVPADDG